MKIHVQTIKEEYKKWNPHTPIKTITEDPYKTIIVGNLAFTTDEERLTEVFEIYGHIKKVFIIRDNEGKSRGYAFIEYENMRGFKSAFRQADGKKVDSRRVIIDAERGRTSKYWRPLRLGGGKGGVDRRAKSLIMRTGERIWNFEKPKSESRSKSRSRSRNKDKWKRSTDKDKKKGKRDKREKSNKKDTKEKKEGKDHDRKKSSRHRGDVDKKKRTGKIIKK